MTYQTTQRTDVDAFLRERWDGHEAEPKITKRDSGAGDLTDRVDDVLDDVLDAFHALDLTQYTSPTAQDGVEGELSVLLYEGVHDLPARTLSDHDFWRFCACRLYEFITFRQPTKTLDALKPYFGVESNGLGRDCVPHRMFNRARIAHEGAEMVGAGDPFELARMRAGDTWKSHVLRVETAFAPHVIHYEIAAVADKRLRVGSGDDSVRGVAKQLRRVHANVMLELLTPDQAKKVVEEAIRKPVEEAG